MILEKALEVADEALHRRTSDTNDIEEQREMLQAIEILHTFRMLLKGIRG